MVIIASCKLDNLFSIHLYTICNTICFSQLFKIIRVGDTIVFFKGVGALVAVKTNIYTVNPLTAE